MSYFDKIFKSACFTILLSIAVGCTQKELSTSHTSEPLPAKTRINPYLQQKPRIVVLTDFGEDPDDEQSMVRFLLYANEFDIEGLLVTADGSDRNSAVQDELLREYIDQYGKVYNNLSQHSPGYPDPSGLKDLVKADKFARKRSAKVGDNHHTDASEHIISVVDEDDPRPIWFVIWGGPRPLSQALWKVKNERSAEEYEAFLDKIRIYSINKQDQTFAWLEDNAQKAFTIVSVAGGGRNQTFRGIYKTGDLSTGDSAWVEENIINSSSPLGQIYPSRGAGVPGIKEGDTPSFLYLLSQRFGLSDSENPHQGGWGGRFLPFSEQWFDDEYALDDLDGTLDRRHSVSRWRTAFNNDFAARIDWSETADVSAVNHPPTVKINGEDKKTIVTLTGQSNTTIPLSAKGSQDPDGDSLTYQWFHYYEVGTYEQKLEIENATSENASVTLPPNFQAGDEAHIILQVSDRGNPPLTRYGRVIITGDSSSAQDLTKIMVLGDSIVQGRKRSNSFRRSLWQKLTAAGYKVDFVGSMNQTKDCTPHPDNDFDPDHEGHWGWRIDEIINGKSEKCWGEGSLSDWLNNYTPDMVLLHLGTNDAIQKNSAASSVEELKQVIDILRADNPDVTIFLATLIPTVDEDSRQRIQELNQLIPDIVAEKQQPNSRIILVDQYSDFQAQSDTYDQVHPNVEGEEKMATKWYEAIEDFLN